MRSQIMNRRFLDDYGIEARRFNSIILMVVVIKLVISILAMAGRPLTLAQMTPYS